MLIKHIEVELTEEIIESGAAIVAIPKSEIHPYKRLYSLKVSPNSLAGDVIGIPYVVHPSEE